jgi:hypothetical protein
MSILSVCQVTRSWVEVGSFHTRLFGVVYVTCGDFHDGSEEGKAACITFCASVWKSATETLAVIQQAIRDQILSLMQVFRWHARFNTGRTSVDDDEHTGRPTSCTTPETVTRIQEFFCQDRRRTIHDIAEEVGNWLWDMPTGSDEIIGHAPCCSQTCAQDPVS